ncbi:MAG: hypothetical protein QFB87_00535 [Patescibacteria group bacterium]|nr:hypothetical protein [Patescibacteria group bacterium]
MQHDNLANKVPQPADPSVIDLTSLSLDEQMVVGDLFAEAVASDMPERRAEVAQLAGEMALSEQVQRQADADIAQAKSYNEHTQTVIAERESEQTIAVDCDKIGWLIGKGTITVPVERNPNDSTAFYFASIIGEHRVTQDAYTHLEAEGVSDYLMDLLKTNGIPRFLEELKGNSGKLRPVNATPGAARNKQRKVNTTYPAYKIDVQGTRNRALVLLPGKINGEQVVVLAAIYDHEDQTKVLNITNV